MKKTTRQLANELRAERGLPPFYDSNNLRPWTPELQKALAADFEKNPDIETLARKYGRTQGAIKFQLNKLGLIEEPVRPRFFWK
jgi:hypothetical protein